MDDEIRRQVKVKYDGFDRDALVRLGDVTDALNWNEVMGSRPDHPREHPVDTVLRLVGQFQRYGTASGSDVIDVFFDE